MATMKTRRLKKLAGYSQLPCLESIGLCRHPDSTGRRNIVLLGLPRQERWVLTSSRDSPDLFGVMDMALGHLKSERDRLVEKARPVPHSYRRIFMELASPPGFKCLNPAW